VTQQKQHAVGGLESVSTTDRVAALTGVRAVAALLVVLTHAAYTTGKYPQGYYGLALSRAEIGVPIFFVLSGFLLFRPWVAAARRASDPASASGYTPPSVRRYAWHRVRRIMPAYVVTVLAAYALYHFREAGPNPGHTWEGLLRNLSLTHIYADNYVYRFLHQGLTQMWSLAVEAAFYVVLPALAWLLLVLLCRRKWRPALLYVGLTGLFAITPAWLVLVHTTDFLPDGARLWLPTYLAWFVGGMLLAVLQVTGARAYALVCIPLAVVSYFIASTPVAGEPTTSPALLSEALVKAVFYAAIATLIVAPLALTGSGGKVSWYSRVLGSRPMVFLGEISYEIFLIHLIIMELVMVEVLRTPVYTGSMMALFIGTLVATIPPAWLLHRCTRVRDR
jgi:peptidoglycan/LPS O-acetylase OafA/YrhL